MTAILSRSNLALCAAALAAALPIAAAQARPATGPTYAVETFAVAGVQLGMDPVQVRRGLAAEGFTVAGNPEGAAPLAARDSAGNLAVVLFRQDGSTPVVSRVVLRFASKDEASLRADLQRTYGTPSYARTLQTSDNWCLAGDPTCDAPIASALPKLYFSWDAGNALTLDHSRPRPTMVTAELAVPEQLAGL